MNSHEEDAITLLQMIISLALLLRRKETVTESRRGDAHLINADAADSDDELTGDLMADVHA